jgi:hypothetical protein
MQAYLNIVQMDLGAAPPHRNTSKGMQAMTILSQLGRIFDASVSVVFIALSLGLAGATAAVGA